MEVYEYYSQVSKNGQLTIPDELKEKLIPEATLRVMVFLEKENLEWNKAAAISFFKGYDDEDNIYDDL